MINRQVFATLAIVEGLTLLSLPAFGQCSTPMRDGDNGARQPVNFGFNISVNNGSGQGFNNTAVIILAREAAGDRDHRFSRPG
jgi:hypothetical protein